MKVIFAGFSKTGTKSMATALRQLGYVVYDFPEQYEYQGKEWSEIFKNGGSTEDFRRMFENVDAVTDLPAGYFWDEIHKAFPEAKIVFSMRANEGEWLESAKRQNIASDKWYLRVFTFISPTAYRLNNYVDTMVRTICGHEFRQTLFRQILVPDIISLMTYRRHNAHVLQNAPKDRLLIYSPKEGWGSLCKFLGKEVPDSPFPHRNKGGNIVDELYNTHPLFIRIKRESLASNAPKDKLLIHSAKDGWEVLVQRYSEHHVPSTVT